MRRKAFIITCMIITFLLTACGGRETTNPALTTNQTSAASDQNAAAQTEAEDTQNENVEVSNSATEEITLELLMNQEETPAEDFEYDVFSDYVGISGYVGFNPVVVIPEAIEGYPVKVVSGLEGAGIKAIRFADSVETIGENCFLSTAILGEEGEPLEIVVFGENLKLIEDMAFAACTKLETIILNDTLEEIGDACFTYTPAKEVTIPASVTKIGDGSFNLSGSQTLYVTAGSYAETWCEEMKQGFRDMVYVVK